jgi:hypothetical protein
LASPYTKIVRRIVRLEQSAWPKYVMVDTGGPGRTVIDMLHAGGSAPTPVAITAKGRFPAEFASAPVP